MVLRVRFAAKSAFWRRRSSTGPVADPRHGFGDAAAIESLLRGGGFDDIRVRTLRRTIRFDDGAIFVHMNAMALVGMSAAGREMPEEERGRAVEAIAAESKPVLDSYTDGSGLAFELCANLATARG